MAELDAGPHGERPAPRARDRHRHRDRQDVGRRPHARRACAPPGSRWPARKPAQSADPDDPGPSDADVLGGGHRRVARDGLPAPPLLHGGDGAADGGRGRSASRPRPSPTCSPSSPGRRRRSTSGWVETVGGPRSPIGRRRRRRHARRAPRPRRRSCSSPTPGSAPSTPCCSRSPRSARSVGCVVFLNRFDAGDDLHRAQPGLARRTQPPRGHRRPRGPRRLREPPLNADALSAPADADGPGPSPVRPTSRPVRSAVDQVLRRDARWSCPRSRASSPMFSKYLCGGVVLDHLHVSPRNRSSWRGVDRRRRRAAARRSTSVQSTGSRSSGSARSSVSRLFRVSTSSAPCV